MYFDIVHVSYLRLNLDTNMHNAGYAGLNLTVVNCPCGEEVGLRQVTTLFSQILGCNLGISYFYY